MAQARTGDTVNVRFTGKLDDGTVFGTSHEFEPLTFQIGESRQIPAFEQAVVGMIAGESRTIRIPCADAYGPHQEEMVVEVQRSILPAHIEPRVGLEVETHQPDGRVFQAMVTAVSERSITLDANHALAGQDLTFDIELIEIL
jgi:peptidylprolyl isomerase